MRPNSTRFPNWTKCSALESSRQDLQVTLNRRIQGGPSLSELAWRLTKKCGISDDSQKVLVEAKRSRSKVATAKLRRRDHRSSLSSQQADPYHHHSTVSSVSGGPHYLFTKIRSLHSNVVSPRGSILLRLKQVWRAFSFFNGTLDPNPCVSNKNWRVTSPLAGSKRHVRHVFLFPSARPAAPLPPPARPLPCEKMSVHA